MSDDDDGCCGCEDCECEGCEACRCGECECSSSFFYAWFCCVTSDAVEVGNESDAKQKSKASAEVPAPPLVMLRTDNGGSR